VDALGLIGQLARPHDGRLGKAKKEEATENVSGYQVGRAPVGFIQGLLREK